MQLVVPSAVMAAVMMLTMNCRIVFQVSFFITPKVYVFVFVFVPVNVLTPKGISERSS